jgi:hypothetical protein
MSLTQTNSKQNIRNGGTFISSSNQPKMFNKIPRDHNSTLEENQTMAKKSIRDHTMQMADVSLNDEDLSQKRGKAKKKTTFSSISSSSLGKKRPKTASREASLTKN